MENIRNFSSPWWKFSQLDLLKKDTQNVENIKNWKKKLKLLSKFIIIGFLVTNVLTFLTALLFDFYTFPLSAERASLMFVLLVGSLRSCVNYLILFINQNKIKKIMEELPEFHPFDEQTEFKISKKLRNSIVPSLFGFLFTFLPWVQKLVTIGVTEYRRGVIGFKFDAINNNQILLAIYNLWPCLNVQMSAGMVVVY